MSDMPRLANQNACRCGVVVWHVVLMITQRTPAIKSSTPYRHHPALRLDGVHQRVDDGFADPETRNWAENVSGTAADAKMLVALLSENSTAPIVHSTMAILHR